MTRIYTRQGDDGTTGTLGAGRLPKDDVRLHAEGSLDELCCLLGLARALAAADCPALDEPLRFLQTVLFHLGCDTAATPEAASRLPGTTPAMLTQLEEHIDALERDLPPLQQFILPAGGRTAATLHQARAVARRAERWLVAQHRRQPLPPQALPVINRLSDLLFVLARTAAHATGHGDEPWQP